MKLKSVFNFEPDKRKVSASDTLQFVDSLNRDDEMDKRDGCSDMLHLGAWPTRLSTRDKLKCVGHLVRELGETLTKAGEQ